ncbi:MAG TPA: OmpA family protein [Candidatus Acidoferrum sp.]|jgi:outer membrane protein OmpA-like peptidoglycan-associated protein
MYKWGVVAVMSALLALPGFAQHRNNDADETTTSDSNETVNVAPAPDFFAMPAMPRATPFPAAERVVEEEPGRLVPRYEIALMYQYINFMPGDPFEHFNNHGGTGSFTFNASRWLGLNAEVGGTNFSRNLFPLTGENGNIQGGLTTFLFGPRLNLRKFDRFVPFGEFMVGAAHGGSQITGDRTQYTFALAAGGGVDIVLWKNLAWRFAQLDYLMTNFSGPALGANARQNNFRAATGVVFRFGIPNPPPPPNQNPVASCAANPTSVYSGSGDSVAIHVTASDPDNDNLTYSYTATGGTVEGTGPDGRWSSNGVNEGPYTVNAKVDDGRGGSATCSADIKVEPKPNRPPTISCAADHTPIQAGERTGITSTASDPDNDPLTYSYSASGGQITGTGAKVEFDSTGLQAGSYTVKCSVSDGKGGTADASTNVDVQQPPPPPQATKVGDCNYGKPGSSRVDNVCKRVLDDVALRLKNDPNAKLVITGYADKHEPRAAKLADTRSDLAKKYLGEKGIDASRISTRPGTASDEKGAEKENRRVDFMFVPEGATY